MINRRTSVQYDVPNPEQGAGLQWSLIPEDDLKEHIKKFKYAYLETLNKLIKFDKERVFRFPVDTSVVPDYTNYVKNPMDFETMLTKNEEFTYKDNIKVFDDDIRLIISNCKTYNSIDTVFYVAALRLEEFYLKLRPLLEKKITTICNLINRKYITGPKPRNKSMLIGSLSPLLNESPTQFPLETNLQTQPQPLPMFDPQIFKKISNDSIESQITKSEMSEDSVPSLVRKKKKKTEPVKSRQTHLVTNEVLNPLNNTIQIALSVSGLTNETFGKLMANFNGLPRLLNSLDVAQHQLVVNQQARAVWGPNSLNRLRRIIKNFEWKRSFDFPLSTAKNSLYRKIQLLMGKYRRETYKKSVETFIGEENLEYLNKVFPNLSKTLDELCVPYQMLSSTTELKY